MMLRRGATNGMTLAATGRRRRRLCSRLTRFLAARAAGDAIVAAYLFGSVARGDDGAGSDVDVALLYQRDPPPTFAALPLRLEGDVERVLGRPADVVTLNTAPVDLCARVLRDGVLLLDRDPSRRIAFEVRTRNVWFDSQPVLRTYRRMTHRPR